MSKKKRPIEWYVQIAEEYLNGEGSSISPERKYGVAEREVRNNAPAPDAPAQYPIAENRRTEKYKAEFIA